MLKRKYMLLSLFICLIGATFIEVASTYNEEWVPYLPSPEQVDLEFWTRDYITYVNVTMFFPTPCYNVSSWGEVSKDGYTLWVNSEIWRWTGLCVQIPWPVSHTYELGYLESRNYIFTFKTWGIDVKSMDFFAFGEYIPPSIEVPFHEPLNPFPSQSVKVSVNVTDAESGVKNVTLWYRTADSSDWYNLTMFYNKTTQLYPATIPGFPGGEGILYRIIAYDNTGNNFIEDNCGEYYAYSVIELLPDINGDGIVNIEDIVLCALAFGSEPDDPNWNPYADLNQDGIIDIVDLVIIGINFGETY